MSVVFSSHYNPVQKHNNKERTMHKFVRVLENLSPNLSAASQCSPRIKTYTSTLSVTGQSTGTSSGCKSVQVFVSYL